jgi:hypothetical protein
MVRRDLGRAQINIIWKLEEAVIEVARAAEYERD